MRESQEQTRGFALITVMFMVTVFASLMGAYFVISRIELSTTRAERNSVSGFYAAEGGLNLRAEEIRQTFVGYNRPEGTTPSLTDACQSSNQGDGDFACQSFAFGSHQTKTFVIEDPSNPVILTIPPGERYQNLNAQEYRYTVRSTATGPEGENEAILELRFKSRLVPLFQFVAFYNKDLEILPGPTMNLAGPIHTNGDLYLETGATLNIGGQITTAGSLYRGRKNNSSCLNNPVNVLNPLVYQNLPACSGRTVIPEASVAPWNGMIQTHVDTVTVPEPEMLDPTPGEIYWDKADLRLVLALNSSNNPDTSKSLTGVEVRKSDDSTDLTLTAAMDSCSGSISGRVANAVTTFYNNREGKNIKMLDVDMLALLNCIDNMDLFGVGKDLNDSSEGGLVFHFTVKGPNSAIAANNYGVRIRNATKLQSTNSGAPTVRGMTVVSDQAIYTWGNFNSTQKIPAAIMGDVYNALSTAWNDANDTLAVNSRVAANTTVYAAILAGTDTTGGVEGSGGQGGAYNGGLENYPRFHENWSGKTFTYLGSFVSLNNPRHQSGSWIYGAPQYTAPNRNWGYDTDFNDAAKLPPLTPRFVYLRQELFVRDYDEEV